MLFSPELVTYYVRDRTPELARDKVSLSARLRAIFSRTHSDKTLPSSRKLNRIGRIPAIRVSFDGHSEKFRIELG